jgi:catechol 2,3-dioxygenase-like lactoylglutathione lyase family enzyme
VGIGFQITFDCDDADRMATFWAAALDYEVETPPDGHRTWTDFLVANHIPVPEAGSVSAIVDPARVGPRLLFLRVPEPKTVKNRVHLDLRLGSDDDKLAKARHLVGAGARQLRRVDEHGGWWLVMADPEGNEFCIT